MKYLILVLSILAVGCATQPRTKSKAPKTVKEAYEKYGSNKEAPTSPVFTEEQLKLQAEEKESETVKQLNKKVDELSVQNQLLQQRNNDLKGNLEKEEKRAKETPKVIVVPKSPSRSPAVENLDQEQELNVPQLID